MNWTIYYFSGSDRIGALDFQASNTLYEPRHTPSPPLQDLLFAAQLVGTTSAFTA